MMTSPRLPSLLKIWKANIGCCESPFQMRSGADTNGCGLCRPLRLKEVERGWVLGMKEVAFCSPYPPPGSSHNSRNLISVSVLYFSDELSSLLLLSTKLRINGRGLMVWNIQVLEWPWLNTPRDTLHFTESVELSVVPFNVAELCCSNLDICWRGREQYVGKGKCHLRQRLEERDLWSNSIQGRLSED